jgi:hypothetical protein
MDNTMTKTGLYRSKLNVVKVTFNTMSTLDTKTNGIKVFHVGRELDMDRVDKTLFLEAEKLAGMSVAMITLDFNLVFALVVKCR